MYLMDGNFKPIGKNDKLIAEILGVSEDGNLNVLYDRLETLTAMATKIFQEDQGQSNSVMEILTEKQIAWREQHPSTNTPGSFKWRNDTILGIEVRNALLGEEATQEFADVINEALTLLAPAFGVVGPKVKFSIGNTPMRDIIAGIDRS